jgi:hypothetical protein
MRRSPEGVLVSCPGSFAEVELPTPVVQLAFNLDDPEEDDTLFDAA